MIKVKFTDKWLASKRLSAYAKAGNPVDFRDTDGPSNFGLRLTGTEEAPVKTFVLLRRWPGSKHPSRRALGRYPALGLAAAHDKAKDWNALADRGIDPGTEEKRQKQAAIEAGKRQKDQSFAAALAKYEEERRDLRSISRTVTTLRNEFKAWQDRPVANIGAEDIRTAINAIKERDKKGKKGEKAKKGEKPKIQARHVFNLLRPFFAWVAESDDFNLGVSPFVGVKKALAGTANPPRDRRLGDELGDAEIRAFWKACDGLGYPYGCAYKLLLWTALRREEVAKARWSEIDFEKRRWMIPAARMKGKNKTARKHLVPLTGHLIGFFEGLPRFANCDYVFSSLGKGQIQDWSNAKKDLDTRMMQELGDRFKPFQVRDLRRTVRSGLSELRIPVEVKESILHHKLPAIIGTYDVFDYVDEKRDALESWHQHLLGIVAQNVVRGDFRQRA
jgi:integrase